MSTHSVPIVQFDETSFSVHSNADSLEIIRVPSTSWQVVSRKGTYKAGDRAVYIPPDYVVPTSYPEFAFLGGVDGSKPLHRMRAIKLRGEVSYGLLIPLPAIMDGLPNGFDVREWLGIFRHEPRMTAPKGSGQGSDRLSFEELPQIPGIGKFDLENLANYPDLLTGTEEIVCTEKIYGSNARYLYQDDKFFVGSRNLWLRTKAPTATVYSTVKWWHKFIGRKPVPMTITGPTPNHIWLKAAQNEPRIEAWCRAHPNTILFGEVYGANVQSLTYGQTDVKFAAFAAHDLNTGHWVPVQDISGVPVVPIVYIGPWQPELILPLAEADSIVDGAPRGHMREGLVITPVVERQSKIGRVSLKHISTRYWTSNAD